MEKIYIKTYGCSNNQAESEIMAGILSKAGYAIADSSDNSIIVIVNTCTVKSRTEDKIIEEIKRLKKRKLIIAGCIVDAYPNIIRKIAPDASIIGTHCITRIDEAVRRMLNNERVEFIDRMHSDKLLLPKKRTSSIIDIIPIESGCISSCAFCATRLAKGSLKSYSIERILNEISRSRSNGYKEFWLTGQDCSCYGIDIGANLPELINSITSNIPGRYFLRIGMQNPLYTKRNVQKLIQAYRHDNVFKFLHLPVQSGSDYILKRMSRGHNVEDYHSIVNEFKKAFPKMTLITDIITGFPGETEDDFEKSINLIKETRPDFVNISKFGSRPGTKASRMKQLTSNTIKERSMRLSEITKEIALEKNREWIGWRGNAIVDEYKKDKKNWLARNTSYKPIIINDNVSLGQIIDVEIINSDRSLIGAVI